MGKTSLVVVTVQGAPLFTILSHFVTLRSCDMNKPNIDKYEILTPKVYLLLQKGLNKNLRTTVVL